MSNPIERTSRLFARLLSTLLGWRWFRLRSRRTVRIAWGHSRRERWHLGWWRRSHREVIRHSHVRLLDKIFYYLFLFLLLDCSLRLIFSRSARLTRTDQNMTRVNLFFILAIFLFGATFVNFDDMETKLRLHDVADLPWLQRKRSLVEFR